MSEKNGSAKPPPGMAEFDQLLGKLAKVPKAELDAEVKKYVQKKARKARGIRKRAN
jgi:hypothetical protein